MTKTCKKCKNTLDISAFNDPDTCMGCEAFMKKECCMDGCGNINCEHCSPMKQKKKLIFNICPSCKQETFIRSIFGNICKNEKCFYQETQSKDNLSQSQSTEKSWREWIKKRDVQNGISESYLIDFIKKTITLAIKEERVKRLTHDSELCRDLVKVERQNLVEMVKERFEDSSVKKYGIDGWEKPLEDIIKTLKN